MPIIKGEYIRPTGDEKFGICVSCNMYSDIYEYQHVKMHDSGSISSDEYYMCHPCYQDELKELYRSEK